MTVTGISRPGRRGERRDQRLRFLRRWQGPLLLAMLILSGGCQPAVSPQTESSRQDPMWTSRRQPADERSQEQADERFAAERRAMVRTQLAARDITDRRVLEAMERVPRHKFVEPDSLHLAYADQPQPLEHGQTISQPYIVALMTQLAQPEPTDKALDIGTGSGYQAAVLAELCAEVYSMEIVEELAAGARGRLERLGYSNIHVRHGDGYRGWPEQAPFDLIVVAAAPKHIPQPLVDQLAVGGRLVLPVGDWHQTLVVVEKQADGTTRSWKVAPVAFVPMTGEAQRVTP